eukprot:CAMPEP_0168327004 /NCGR_PEP_ID=MMETSP0213-20121227/5647_1 /TAXON_ID=151035 /ORGANISM="Euplotes harpa, Strain FSP1.4" /LENGTH=73 /DNA_ID=CAMNT_0008329841 /DNA_START=1 /DNA_END=219 /DNA_ORIENTATION=+
MNTDYEKVDHEADGRSDASIHMESNQMNYQMPPQYYQPQAQQPVNILAGPGYKLYDAQSQVSKWTWYINVFAW